MRRNLDIDRLFWVMFLLAAAVLAFALLKRDVQNQFGAVSYGGVPYFRFPDASGHLYDQHALKAHAWALYIRLPGADNDAVVRELAEYSLRTGHDKHSLRVLIFSSDTVPAVPPATNDSVLTLYAAPEELQTLAYHLRFAGRPRVLLVDQESIIRGVYDFSRLDDHRRFQLQAERVL